MGLTQNELNARADALAAKYPFLALHTADPGTTGINESLAARVAAGWPPAVNGAISVSNKAFSGGAASGPCLFVALWTAGTGGTFGGSYALTGDQSFNAAGQYTLTSLTITDANA